MTGETLFELFAEIDDAYICEARDTAVKARKPVWLRFAALAASVCLILSVGAYAFLSASDYNGGCGPFVTGRVKLEKPHREEITPVIGDATLAQIEAAMREEIAAGQDKEWVGDMTCDIHKTYLLVDSDWFLSEKLTDFSQAVTDTVRYHVIRKDDRGYTTYAVGKRGVIEWKGSARTVEEETELPQDLVGLTHERIRQALEGVAYDDYVVTWSDILNTVFVWVRGETDRIIPYPSRPDFIPLESGRVYTLPELQEALATPEQS